MIPSLNRVSLPVDHPDYHYPPSRNPYGKKLNDTFQFVLSDHSTETHHGSWRSQFQPPTLQPAAFPSSGLHRDLHVEIGCNAGHVITEWAKANPNHLYIGIDWKFKAIFKAAEKAKKASLSNVLFFRAHAHRLPYMFDSGELSSLSIFFPDPWPKTAHTKNRYITHSRLKILGDLLKPNGVLHIKTDHEGYFLAILKAVQGLEEIFEPFEQTKNLHENHPDPESLRVPEVTLFEKIFIRQKIPIKQLKLRKKMLEHSESFASIETKAAFESTLLF